MGLVSFDESMWPLVVITWGAGVATDADVEGMLGKLSEYLTRETTYAVVLDSRAGSGVSAKHRQMIGTFNRVNAVAMGAHAKIALVLATPLQRGLVTAIGWIAPPAHEQKVFSDPGVAEDWCRMRLGLPLRSRTA